MLRIICSLNFKIWTAIQSYNEVQTNWIGKVRESLTCKIMIFFVVLKWEELKVLDYAMDEIQERIKIVGNR